jgi:hypothetical protein
MTDEERRLLIAATLDGSVQPWDRSSSRPGWRVVKQEDGIERGYFCYSVAEVLRALTDRKSPTWFSIVDE